MPPMAKPHSFPDAPEGPAWVDDWAKDTKGLDLLGLRLVVQALQATLLNGITTITPRVRYLSLRTWLIDVYWSAPGRRPDTTKGFLTFSGPGEAAFALANLHRDPGTLYLVGTRWARPRLQEGTPVIVLERLWSQRAMNNYARASEQLRLSRAGVTGAPDVGAARGLPLARAAATSFESTRIGRRIAQGEVLDSLPREEIEEFAAVTSVIDIPDPERRCLLDAVLPAQPVDHLEWWRLGTYGLLLELAHRQAETEDPEPLDPAHVWTEAILGPARVPASLAPVLDEWLLYLIRDALAVTAEATLQGSLEALRDLAGAGGAAEDEAVVARQAGDLEPVRDALDGLGLLEPGEGTAEVAAFTFRTLEARLRARTPIEGALSPADSLLARWPNGLDELQVIRAGEGNGRAGAALLLVAWMLAERRAGGAPVAGSAAAHVLDYRGVERMGLSAVILPQLARWRAADAALPVIMAELIYRVVEQHLRIAWARLAAQSNDVAMLAREGTLWVHRRDYEGGRSASRIPAAIGWLEQLRLIEAAGSGHALTPEGVSMRAQVLAALEAGPPGAESSALAAFAALGAGGADSA
jgi:hypothetical protein